MANIRIWTKWKMHSSFLHSREPTLIQKKVKKNCNLELFERFNSNQVRVKPNQDQKKGKDANYIKAIL